MTFKIVCDVPRTGHERVVERLRSDLLLPGEKVDVTFIPNWGVDVRLIFHSDDCTSLLKRLEVFMAESELDGRIK